ncbi:unnamed protein product, partial [Allacma fusca]
VKFGIWDPRSEHIQTKQAPAWTSQI